MQKSTTFEDSFSKEIWESTYKYYDDSTLDDTFFRVAKAIASVEKTEELKKEWTDKFYDMLTGFKITTGGRIYANAGTQYNGTSLINCVSGETLVYTDKGQIEAKNLVDSTVNVLTDDGEFRPANWFCYGKQPLLKVTLENGDELFATSEHEWITKSVWERKKYQSAKNNRTKTVDLVGKRIPFNTENSVFEYNEEEFKIGLKHGLVYGDGSLYNNSKFSQLKQFGDSCHLVEDFFEHYREAFYKENIKSVITINHPKEWKISIPTINDTKSYVRGFIAGMIASDGHVDSRGHVSIFQSDLEFLNELKLLCNYVGIAVSSIKVYREINPYNGKYSPCWKLTLVKKSLDEHLIVKNSHKENFINSFKAKAVQTVKVVSVEKTDRFEDVYCCVEPVTHTMTIGNMYLTGQCFVSPREESDIDSVNGIVKNLLNQMLTLKSEGGWGENFSYIRPRGSFIKSIGVESPGAVKYMELFDKSSDIITAGSGKTTSNVKGKKKIRKGAMMGCLNDWHPDIIEFITAKQQPGRLQKFNVSVLLSNDFMKKLQKITELKNNNASAQEIELESKWDLKFPDTSFDKFKTEWDGDIKGWESKKYPVIIHNTVNVETLWNLIMESTYNRAEPGVLFGDVINEMNPFYYGEKISATNPSMPAGTLVHTYDGIFPIEQLENKEFKVKSLDGVWANASCRLSGENEQLLKITYTKNKFVFSTEKHRWPVYDPKTKTINKKDASELKPGDLIPLNRNEPIEIHGDETLTFDEGFMVGYILGDGWISKRKTEKERYSIGLTFGLTEYSLAEKLLKIINSLKENKSTITKRETEYNIQITDINFAKLLIEKYGLSSDDKDIPASVWKSNPEYIRGFVDGLISSDGTVSHGKNKNPAISFSSSRKNLAMNFAKLIGFAGVPCTIGHTTLKDIVFPNGKNYNKSYERYTITISGRSIINFCNVFSISHENKKQKLNEALIKCQQNRKKYTTSFVKVKNVEFASKEKVWDISVNHNQHVFPTEWSYTGNCGEQTLAPAGICCLASMNLTQFINEERTDFDYEKIKKYVRYLVRFLDNVNSYSLAPLSEYKFSMENKRRVGCGVLGWGSALFLMKVKFASEKAQEIQEKLMKTFSKECYKTSIDLAEEKGMFSLCDPKKHADSKFIKNIELDDNYIEKLKIYGIRNSSLLSIQPTGNSSIFANIVSGGCEPIFMPEYIRTVIVNSVPEHIKDVTPKWYEGEWKETSMFKNYNEGNDEMLRGVDEFGVVYKIDKNRGLTREVLCEDYAVRHLKASNEWNPSADWAVTTTELSVDEHLVDLKGFAKYIDSAISKTINIPHEYSFDEFKKVYFDAWKTGYIKGLTTYRSGTMMSVLSAKESEDVTDEEIILDSVKLDDSHPAVLKTLKSEGRKWYLTLTMDSTGTRPIALFVHTNSPEKSAITHNAVDKLIELAKDKGIPDVWIENTIKKMEHDNNVTKIARMIGLNLRHGVHIKNVVSTLNEIDTTVNTFIFQIRKFLSQYIKDGTKVENAVCDNCGSSNIEYREGCTICKDCGNSKCS